MNSDIERLLDLGAKHETKKDQFGDIKSGWWQDTVYLAPYNEPKLAIEAIEG